MKPCPHCGKDLPQEMQFCPYCMEKLMPETVITDTSHHRHRRWWLWILMILLLLLLLVGGWWLRKQWRISPTPNQEDAVASASRTTTAITTTVHTTATSTATTKTTSTIATTTTTVAETTSSTTTATTTTATTTGTTMPTTMSSVATGSTMRTTAHTTAHTTVRTTAHTTAHTTVRTTAHTTAAPCAAGHSWEDITQTVQVDEVGHYEKKTVEKRVTLYRCALCYEEHSALEDYYAHFDAEHNGDSLEIVFRDRYETFAEYREVEEQQWVVDTPAYDKTVTVGRRCRICGKTETNEHKE